MKGRKDYSEKQLKRQISSLTAVTIPVNLIIDSKQRIFDLTETENILKEASLISLGNCYCREKHKRCNNPLDVCIGLDQRARKLIDNGSAREVGLSEALDALKRSHNAGLVHISYTSKGEKKPRHICGCCSCCCPSMSALVRFGMSGAVIPSKYISITNAETCKNCGICAKRCQFKARTFANGKMSYESTRCFGCGLCVTTCPTRSISLTTRNSEPTGATAFVA
jgi:Pyruvate/2-oxoacid:ferredoxin oxidoreductase delta subunit